MPGLPAPTCPPCPPCLPPEPGPPPPPPQAAFAPGRSVRHGHPRLPPPPRPTLLHYSRECACTRRVYLPPSPAHHVHNCVRLCLRLCVWVCECVYALSVYALSERVCPVRVRRCVHVRLPTLVDRVPALCCMLAILMFGVFKDSETQQPFQFGIAVVAAVACIILYMLASAIVFHSTRRKKLRAVRRQPKVADNTPEVGVVEPVISLPSAK
jgi:hypothetical protein